MCDADLTDPSQNELLHDSPEGTLGYCPGCRAFGLTFGCLHIRLGARAVLSLMRTVESMEQSPSRDSDRHWIHFEGTPATLALSDLELANLSSVLRDGCDRAHEVSTLEQAGPDFEVEPSLVN